MSRTPYLCTVLIAIAAWCATTPVLAATTPAVGTIYLRMDPVDAEVVMRKDSFDKSSFAVSILDGDTQLNGRIKVSGSSSRSLEKRSLYIKLNKGVKWHGQSRISLNASGSDPTLMRNRLVRDILQAIGEVGPKTTYQQVYLNGKPIGLYLQIEWVERPLFARDGLGGEGQLYHPNDKYFCGDLDKSNKMDVDDCWLHFTPPFDDYAPLEKLIKGIDETPISQFDTFMEKNFDVDSVINWIAINVLVADGDTYNKNYFLYLDNLTDKWTVVPWDYDLTFGRNFDPYLDYPKNIFNDNYEYFYPPELGAYNPLKMKLLRNPILLNRFRQRLAHLLGLQQESGEPGFAIFSPQAMSVRINDLKALLLPEIQKDPFLRDHQAEFFENVEALAYFVRARYGYLKTAVFGRSPWNPDLAYWHPEQVPPPGPYPDRLQALAEGSGSVAVVGDGFGYVLAIMKPANPSLSIGMSAVSIFDQPPLQVPPQFTPGECIQRTWRVTLSFPAEPVLGDLTLEYLQENSHRNERGGIKNESLLQLWRDDGAGWQQLPVHINTLANTLTTTGLVMQQDKPQRFVACAPQQTGKTK